MLTRQEDEEAQETKDDYSIGLFSLYAHSRSYQLRAHLFQVRALLLGDADRG